MNRYSRASEERLKTVHPNLALVFRTVLPSWDHTIICGHRGEEAQTRAYRMGQSKVRFPNSKHNEYPSLAVDVAPYPIVWSDYYRFYYFAGYVQRVALELGVKIRFGGDWDMDTFAQNDQSFFDLVHFELIEPKSIVGASA